MDDRTILNYSRSTNMITYANLPVFLSVVMFRCVMVPHLLNRSRISLSDASRGILPTYTYGAQSAYKYVSSVAAHPCRPYHANTCTFECLNQAAYGGKGISKGDPRYGQGAARSCRKGHVLTLLQPSGRSVYLLFRSVFAAGSPSMEKNEGMRHVKR